jgi:hypothetical protein
MAVRRGVIWISYSIDEVARAFAAKKSLCACGVAGLVPECYGAT